MRKIERILRLENIERKFYEEKREDTKVRKY